MSAIKQISGTHGVVPSTSEVQAGIRMSWPRAALVILALSLGLWLVVAAILTLALN